MKKFFVTIGCLGFTTLLGLAQSSTDVPNNLGAAGTGAQPYPGHDPAFHASGGSGHGVGINGGTRSGTIVGTPYSAAGAQPTNRVQRTNSHTLHASPPRHSP
jgi:hypothetical protein